VDAVLDRFRGRRQSLFDGASRAARNPG